MIETTFNLRQAEALFNEECVILGQRNVFPLFRAIELFGRAGGEWMEGCMGLNGFLDSGTDHSSWWTGSGEHVNFLTFSGFLKLIAWHNCIILARRNDASEGGRIWQELEQARRARLDAEDAKAAEEEERKRKERRAKRAAAQKKKQESEATA